MTAVAFYTLGCKVNQYESEAIMDLFKENGYQIVDFQDKADIYIINSCTVTNLAASKSRKYARRAKRRNQKATVVMVGCYSQVSPEEIEEIEEVDLILGTENKAEIVDLIEKNSDTDSGEKYLDKIQNHEQLKQFENLNIKELRETTRGYIKIQEGCNQYCSYCIIPYARGPLRSRGLKSILKEVKGLVNQGVKEIVLTGIHLGAFGYERDNKQALNQLLKKLIKIDGLTRIRLSSLEITEINEELMHIIKNEEKVCPHLHIPLQSGCNKILKKMRRPYNKEEFKCKVKKIRKMIPGIAISTDVMVGFPGETAEDFKKTYDFINQISFSRLHVFPYSPREGTPAAEMDNQLSGDIKNSRSKKLRNLNQKLMVNYQKKFLGTDKKIIIETEKVINNQKFWSGLTNNYLKILIKKDTGINYGQGDIVKVRLKEIYNYQNILGIII